MRFRVNFTGCAYVEADSEDEAIDKFINGDAIYQEYEADSAEEASDYLIDI